MSTRRPKAFPRDLGLTVGRMGLCQAERAKLLLERARMLSGGLLTSTLAWYFRLKKMSVSTLFLAIFVVVSGASAQDKSAEEPKYINQFLFIDATTGALKPLEHFVVATESTKKSSLAYVPNERSSVRFTNPNVPAFVVRFQSPDLDPTNVIQFFRLTPKRGRREVDMTPNKLHEIEVRYNIVKYGTGSFRVTPKAPLPPGEYVFSSVTQDVYCFGVDGQAADPGATAPEVTEQLSEPKYRNRYYVLTNGTLKPLEHVALTETTKLNSHGFSGSQDQVQIAPGSSSSVQVAPDSHFVVRLANSDIDPETMIHLKPFKVGKEERVIVAVSTSVTPFRYGKSKVAEDTSVKISINKFGADSLEIIPSTPLEPGEYLFSVDALQADCFGVKAK